MTTTFVARDASGAIPTLRRVVEHGFEGTPLERLHEGVSYELFERATDQATVLHQRFYDDIVPSAGWRNAYGRFVEQVVRPRFGESIAYQAVPTFRVHLPGNVAVGEFHSDRDYGHAAEAVNVWVPLTDAVRTATIHVAPKPGPVPEESCLPIEARQGEYLVFDGASYLHGNLRNEEGYTRVSIDVRVIPLSRYRESDARSVNTRARLAIGDYYAVLD